MVGKPRIDQTQAHLQVANRPSSQGWSLPWARSKRLAMRSDPSSQVRRAAFDEGLMFRSGLDRRSAMSAGAVSPSSETLPC
jgi:hypothetical protein